MMAAALVYGGFWQLFICPKTKKKKNFLNCFQINQSKIQSRQMCFFLKITFKIIYFIHLLLIVTEEKASNIL